MMKTFFLLALASVGVAIAYVGDADHARRRVLAERELSDRGEYIAMFDCDNRRHCNNIRDKLRTRATQYCFSDSNETTELDTVREENGKIIDFVVFTCQNPSVLGLGENGTEDETYNQYFAKISGEAVEYEQNSLVEVTGLPPSDWNLDRSDQPGLPLDHKNLQTEYTGYGVTIYVIDTGINRKHVEFTDRASYGPNYALEDYEEDLNGHGTHCAGTAAGKTYGFAKEARIIAVKVLGRSGFGDIIRVAEGVKWAMEDAKKEGKPSVISMSIGGSPSKILDTWVSQAAKENIVVVAAGNNAKDACKYSPSRSGGSGHKGGVITVGATNIKDKRAVFSNFGKCVDMWAPGEDITSAYMSKELNNKNTKTAVLSGTSMATPAVAGVAALLMEKHNLNKNKAQAELFRLVAQKKLKKIGKRSKNKLLQVPEDKNNLRNSPPTPYPTFGPTKVCVGNLCTMDFESSRFGPVAYHELYQGEAVVPNTNMCGAVKNDLYKNKILIVKRDPACFFFQKVINAQRAGAVAVIFVNSDNNPVPPIYRGDDAHLAQIPSCMVGKSMGKKFIARKGELAKFGSV